jgi:hypothetical protein
MPGIQVPTQFTVTKDCAIEGTVYAKGTIISAADAAAFKKLNVLVANRTLLPDVDQYQRRTDDTGFGEPPRKHPTPSGYNPKAVQEMLP